MHIPFSATPFITRQANWGQPVTIYDINTKHLCPVVIYGLWLKLRLTEKKKKYWMNIYAYMHIYIYIGIILSFMRFYCLLAIISALKRCQPATAHKVEQLIKFYGNCNSSEATDKWSDCNPDIHIYIHTYIHITISGIWYFFLIAHI